MRAQYLVVATAILALSVPVLAQDRGAAIPRSGSQGGSSGGNSGGGNGGSGNSGSGTMDTGARSRPAAPPQRTAQPPRGGERPQADRGDSARSRPSAARPAPRAEQSQRPNPQAERRAEPRGSRPQGVNPGTGIAVPRGPGPRPGPGSVGIYTPWRRSYNYYSYPRYIYSYPRSIYPYGYGAFGLGYYYYDPFRWHPHYWGIYYDQWPVGRDYDVGELHLDVSPRTAEVWVDGYYAGIVDDFDGAFQSLRLEAGGYRIELVAPGYDSLIVDVRISPGRKTTFRGSLGRD